MCVCVLWCVSFCVCLIVQLTPSCTPVRSVEEIERPLAQSLEGWVLQQAVTGLMLGGQLEQAEALCSQVGYQHTHTFTHNLSIFFSHLFHCRKG